MQNPMRNIPVITRAIFLTCIFVLFVFLAGCAKDVGNDKVVQIAQTVRVSANFLTVQGIGLLERYEPREVEATKSDLGAIVDVAKKYADGKVTVGDVVSTITIVLDRLNERFELVEADGVSVILATISALGQIVEIYFVEADLPQEAGIYLNSFAIGIQDGLNELAD